MITQHEKFELNNVNIILVLSILRENGTDLIIHSMYAPYVVLCEDNRPVH